jgi:hypothetical protein
MNSLKMSVAAGVLSGMGLCALPMIASAAPQLTIQSERAAHPRLVEAIRLLQDGLKELEAAPDDFGGNKAADHRYAPGHSFFEASAVLPIEDG